MVEWPDHCPPRNPKSAWWQVLLHALEINVPACFARAHYAGLEFRVMHNSPPPQTPSTCPSPGVLHEPV